MIRWQILQIKTEIHRVRKHISGSVDFGSSLHLKMMPNMVISASNGVVHLFQCPRRYLLSTAQIS